MGENLSHKAHVIVIYLKKQLDNWSVGLDSHILRRCMIHQGSGSDSLLYVYVLDGQPGDVC